MTIGFIGAGKVGRALGIYFLKYGLSVSGYYSRTRSSAQEAAWLTGTRDFDAIESLADTCDIVFLTVSDHALEEIDSAISQKIRRHEITAKKIWVHVSGAYPSDCLCRIKMTGCAVGSMHPLQSFGDPVASAQRLNSAWFTLEGTDKAVLSIQKILKKTGGKYSRIQAENKPLYHSGACVVSNYLVTLLENGIALFEAAGMNRETIFQAIEPLIDATLSNIREQGTINALTGPIVRADFNTVQVHMQAIEKRLPMVLDFYSSMALKTAQMIEDTRLSKEQVKQFQRMLEETNDGG